MKFPISPVCKKFDISLTVEDIWLYPLQDWWRTVNEMSNFLHAGEIGNFIFRPVSPEPTCPGSPIAPLFPPTPSLLLGHLLFSLLWLGLYYLHVYNCCQNSMLLVFDQ